MAAQRVRAAPRRGRDLRRRDRAGRRRRFGRSRDDVDRLAGRLLHAPRAVAGAGQRRSDDDPAGHLRPRIAGAARGDPRCA